MGKSVRQKDDWGGTLAEDQKDDWGGTLVADEEKKNLVGNDLSNGTSPTSQSLSKYAFNPLEKVLHTESSNTPIPIPPTKKEVLTANDRYATELDTELQGVLRKSERKITPKSYGSSMSGGTVEQPYKLPFSDFNPNDDKSYETIINELKTSDKVEGLDGDYDKAKVSDLIKKLQQRKLLLIAKKGITPIEGKAYPEFDEKQNEDYFKTKIEDATGTFMATSKLVKDPSQSIKTAKLTEENFRYGLEELKTSDRGKYNNILASLKEKGKVAEPDFERIAELGQVIRNQKTFIDNADNPDSDGEVSNIKYLGNSYESKKAIAASKMGEWLKKNGGTNQSEFTEDQMRRAAKATGLNDDEILKDLIFNEKLVGVDAIPKSGLLPSFFDRGLFTPINSITNTLSGIGDTQAETYLKSNSLGNTGIGADKIIDSAGEVGEKLSSEKDNILYGAIEGLGQFVTQAALTGGIGGGIRAAAGGLSKGLIGEGATAALVSSQEAAKAAMFTGTFASTYLQEYGQSYADALEKTGDVATAKKMANLNSTAAALFEELLPDAKVADNILGAFKKKGFANTLLDIVKKGGDPNELLKEGKTALVKFLGTAGDVVSQENLEEIGTRITQQAIETVYSPDTAKNVDLGDEILETIKATTIQTILPAILSGGSSALQKDFTQKSLHDAALNVEQYKRGFDELLANEKISQDDYNKSISLIQTHKNSIHNAPETDANGQRIKREDRLEFATQQTSIKMNNAKLENKELSAPEIKNLNDKIKQAENIQEEIFNPKNKADEKAKTKTDAQTNEGQETVLAPIQEAGTTTASVVTEEETAATEKPRVRVKVGTPPEAGEAKIESAIIEINGKIYEGKNHAAAILSAKEDGKDISEVDRAKDGKFKLSDGTIINRAEAKTKFGQDRSELLIPQDEAANQANKDYAALTKTTDEVVSPSTVKSEEVKPVTVTGWRVGKDDGGFISKTKDYSEEYGVLFDIDGEPYQKTETFNNPLKVELSHEDFTDGNVQNRYIEKAKKDGNDGVIFTPDKDANWEGEEFYVKIKSENKPIQSEQPTAAVSEPVQPEQSAAKEQTTEKPVQQSPESDNGTTTAGATTIRVKPARARTVQSTSTERQPIGAAIKPTTNETEQKQQPQSTVTGTAESNPVTGQGADGTPVKKTRKRVKGTKKANRVIRHPGQLQALKHEVTKPFDMVLQYFIGGGKVNSSSIEEVFGNKGRKSVNKEVLRHTGILYQYAPSLNDVAHKMWDNLPEHLQDKYPSTDFEQAVISVIEGFTNATEMATDLNKRLGEELSDLDQEYAKYYEQTYEQIPNEEILNDVIDIVDELTDEEVQRIIAEDESGQEAYINQLLDQHNNGALFSAKDTRTAEQVLQDEVTDQEAAELEKYSNVGRMFLNFMNGIKNIPDAVAKIFNRVLNAIKDTAKFTALATIALTSVNNANAAVTKDTSYTKGITGKLTKASLVNEYGDRMTHRWSDYKILDKKAASGKTYRQIFNQIAEDYGLPVEVLFASTAEEGLRRHVNTPFDTQDKNYPISGFEDFGLDNFTSMFPALVKEGYLDKDFPFKISNERNEKNEVVKSANFKTVEDAITAKAAILTYSDAKVVEFADKNNITISPDAQDFFMVVAYNAGLGNATKMLSDYNKAGALNNDEFLYDRPTKANDKVKLSQNSWADPYEYAMRRVIPADAWKEKGVFADSKSIALFSSKDTDISNDEDSFAELDSPDEVANSFVAKNLKSLQALATKSGNDIADVIKDFYQWVKTGVARFSDLAKEYAKIAITSIALATVPSQQIANSNAPVIEQKKDADSKAKKTISDLLQSYYQENDEQAPQEVIDRAVYLWQVFGKPEILPDSTKANDRAYALNQQPIVLGNITNFDDFIAELSHAAQYVSDADLDDESYATEIERDSIEYERKGSTEYDAHTLIEPMIARFILDGTKGAALAKTIEGQNAVKKYGLNTALFSSADEQKLSSSDMQDLIKYVSDKTGLIFRQSDSSNSWYATDKNGKKIRVSDHPSKFVEKAKDLGNKAIDLDINYYSKGAIIDLINETDPFVNYKKGDKIIHSANHIGQVEYLSSDYKKGYVEVLTKDGRVVKYDMGKFLSKQNDAQALFSIVGEKANLDQDVRNNLSVARQMEEAGKTSEEIYLATGWERGADKNFKYEIPDVTLNMEKVGESGDIELKDMIKPNSELVKAHPELGNAVIEFVPNMEGLGAYQFNENTYNEKTGQYEEQGQHVIQLNTILLDNIPQLKKVLIHEIQHGIQKIEGFATGGNMLTGGFFPKEAFLDKSQKDRLKEIDKLWEQLRDSDLDGDEFYKKRSSLFDERKGIYDAVKEKVSIEDAKYGFYKNLAGEVEARNVETRSDLTEQQRKEIPLSYTEDVARKDQILYFGNGVQERATEFPSSKQIDEFQTDNNNSRPVSVGLLQKKYPDAVVKQSQDDLPDEIKEQAEDQEVGLIEGVLHNGVVYLVADNLDNMGRAEAVYKHEKIGHGGVISLLGGSIDSFATSLVDNSTGIQRKQIERLSKFRKKKGVNELDDAEKSTIGQEYIAKAAENPDNYNITFAKIGVFIRSIIRKLGIKISITDNDIKVLLKRALRRVGELNDRTVFSQQSKDDWQTRMDEMLKKVREQNQAQENIETISDDDKYLLDEYIGFVTDSNKNATADDVIAAIEAEDPNAKDYFYIGEDERQSFYDYIRSKLPSTEEKKKSKGESKHGSKKGSSNDDGNTPPPNNDTDSKELNNDDNFLKSFDLRTSSKLSDNESIETLKKNGYSPDLMDTKEKVETLELDLRKDDANDIIQKAKDVWGDDITVWGKKLYQKALGLMGLDKTIESGNATAEKQLLTLIKLRKELNNSFLNLTNRINFSEDKVEQQALKNDRSKVQNIQRQVNAAVEQIGNNASRKLNLLRLEKTFDGVALVTNIRNKITGQEIANDFDKVNEAIKEEIGVEEPIEQEKTGKEKNDEIDNDLKEPKTKKRAISKNAKSQASKKQSTLDKIKALAESIKKDLNDPITPCS